MLNDVRIEDGTVRIIYDANGAERRIEHINANLSLPHLVDPLTAKGDFDWKGMRVGFDLKLTSPADLERRSARLDLALTTDAITPPFGGNIAAKPAFSAEGDLTAKSQSVPSMLAWLRKEPPGRHRRRQRRSVEPCRLAGERDHLHPDALCAQPCDRPRPGGAHADRAQDRISAPRWRSRRSISIRSCREVRRRALRSRPRRRRPMGLGRPSLLRLPPPTPRNAPHSRSPIPTAREAQAPAAPAPPPSAARRAGRSAERDARGLRRRRQCQCARDEGGKADHRPELARL